jgi:hypothetical protein
VYRQDRMNAPAVPAVRTCGFIRVDSGKPDLPDRDMNILASQDRPQ